jgi:hypothetical protein
MIEPTGYCFECGEILPVTHLYYCPGATCRKSYLDKHPAPSKARSLSEEKFRYVSKAEVQRLEREERERELIKLGFAPPYTPFSRAAQGAPKCKHNGCPRRLGLPSEIKAGECLKHIQERLHRGHEIKVHVTSQKSRDYQQAKKNQP